MLILESRLLFFFIAIVFRLSLEFGYREFVSPVFEYAGFLIDFVALKYLESWIIFLILVGIFPCRLKKPSDYLMGYMLFAFLSPLLVFYGLSNASREHLYAVLLCVLLICIFRLGRTIKIPVLSHSRYIALGGLVMGVTVVTAWMVASGGVSFFNLDLTRVYEFRGEVGDVVNRGVMGYLNVWASSVFGPVLLAYALWKKHHFLALIMVLLHVLWFGISSHKSVLFYPFLIFFIWLWFRSGRAISVIPLGMSLVVMVSYFISMIFDDIFAGSLLIRRVFFVPSLLTFTYFDFFSNNPFVYWSSSFMSFLIKYPYDLNTARIIGDYLNTEANANNSFFSTGYMHAGIWGVILYGVLVGFIFRLVDNVSARGIPVWFAISAVIVPAQSLILSSDLPTALLTHGIGIAILVLFLMRKSNDREGQSKAKNF